jgi:hypothetical protein
MIMQKILIFGLFILASLYSHSQIFYSSQIRENQLKLFKELEGTLKKIPFTLPKVIEDTARLSADDSITYSKIFTQFFDTAQIKLLRTPQTYYMKFEEEENWLKVMTVNGIIGIHNTLSCVPDSIIFVMPASEYNLLDKNDERVRYASNELLVAGYKAGGFYYPMFSILFSKLQQKIVYINLVINFERYPPEKEDYFNTYLEPILAPCVRRFSENYGNRNNIPADKINQDTTRVTF